MDIFKAAGTMAFEETKDFLYQFTADTDTRETRKMRSIGATINLACYIYNVNTVALAATVALGVLQAISLPATIVFTALCLANMQVLDKMFDAAAPTLQGILSSIFNQKMRPKCVSMLNIPLFYKPPFSL